MRAFRSLLLVVAALSPAACSSLNQGVLDGGAGDAPDAASLDGGDVVDAPAVDAIDAPAVDAIDAPSVDVVDASVMDAIDAPSVDVVDASVMDVVDAPAADVVDVPRVDAVADCGADVLSCSGACVSNPSTDPLNCGRCGNICSLPHVVTPVCSAGACVPGACATGFDNCDGMAANGCEVALSTNPSHCGRCGSACPTRTNAVPSCAAGACGVTCMSGFGDCDASAENGCETVTSNNILHCGACRNACPTRSNSAPLCSFGVCRNACNAGFGDCDGNLANGCEASLSTDPEHCGSCTRSCGGATGCAAGACVEIPTPRAVAPLSTSTVTSQSPTLRWINGPGATGAVIHLANNPLFSGESTIAVPNGNNLFLNSLSAGQWYWFAQGVSGAASNTGARTSPVWQFIVGNRSAAVDRSFGTASDFNRNGYGDVVLAAPEAATTTSTSPASTGRARLYLGIASGLSASTLLQGGGAETGGTAISHYGRSVATGGDTNGDGFPELLISGEDTTTGHVFVHHGNVVGFASTPSRVLHGDAGATTFGRSISSAGDVNGDGYADIIVGGTGRAYLFHGTADGIVTTPSALLDGVADEDFGYAVSSAGDVNGDGFGDVLVGAPTFGSSTGRFYLYLGSASGIIRAPNVTQSGRFASGRFGASLASAGDINGDGYADVVIGAPDVNSQGGEVTIYLGGGVRVLLTSSPITLAGPVMQGRLGAAVAGVGDVDADGFGDVVVGAPGNNNLPGSAYLIRGASAPSSAATAITLDPSAMPPGMGGRFGAAVSGIGDANRDGFMDFVVGAPCAPAGSGCGAGRVFHFRGAATPPTRYFEVLSTSDAAGSNFGAATSR